MTDKKIQVRSTEEALKLALESAAGLALEVLKKHRQMKGEYPMGMLGVRAVEELEAVFSEMDEALAEQPAQQQEPVAEVRCDDGGNLTAKFHVRDLPLFALLYTSPPIEATPLASQRSVKPWVGLTDEERNWLRKRNQKHDDYAKAVEALLKEKNT